MNRDEVIGILCKHNRWRRGGYGAMSETKAAPKQERYINESGEDWIDECAKGMTKEEFRGAMKFTIGKYLRRAGKKDDIPQELGKITDYCARWIRYEIENE